MKRSTFFNLLLSFVFFFILSSIAVSDSNISDISEITAIKEPKSLFDIRFVDYDRIDALRYYSGPDSQTLQTRPGLIIGLITQDTLWLRGDLTDEFLIEDNSETELTRNEIYEHLLDISFGRSNSRLSLFNNDKKYLIWFDSAYQSQDIDAVREWIALLNSLSQTVEFEDEQIGLPSLKKNYEKMPYNYYQVSIVKPDNLNDLIDNRKDNERILRDSKGKQIGLVRADRLWLDNELYPDERRYFILRGLLWSMGLMGESPSPTSFFSSSINISSEFSELDRKAIELLYGGRLQSGMDVEELRKNLGLI